MGCVHRHRSTDSSRDQQEKDEGRSRPAKGDRVTRVPSRQKSSKGTTGGWCGFISHASRARYLPWARTTPGWEIFFFLVGANARQVRADCDARVNAACVRAGTGPRSLVSPAARARPPWRAHAEEQPGAHVCPEKIRVRFCALIELLRQPRLLFDNRFDTRQTSVSLLETTSTLCPHTAVAPPSTTAMAASSSPSMPASKKRCWVLMFKDIKNINGEGKGVAQSSCFGMQSSCSTY